jgi:hypothetical protein
MKIIRVKVLTICTEVLKNDGPHFTLGHLAGCRDRCCLLAASTQVAVSCGMRNQRRPEPLPNENGDRVKARGYGRV